MVEADLVARAELSYFKEVVIPERIAEVERDLTALMQEFAQGTEVRFEVDPS